MNIIKPNWPAPTNIKAFTTLKKFKEEELSLITNGNPMFRLQQEHGINILPATNSTTITTADGSFTQQKNIVCLIKTADCLPILITNKQGSFVAALHAGWRGLANEIIKNFFIQTKNLKLNYKELLFWLGPAIGPNVFEVGEDVLQNFNSLYHIAFKKIVEQKNKYLADLYKIAKIALLQCNIEDSQIFSGNWCTYSQQNLFYSYRRDPSTLNRMFSLIWMN